ncbi:uncharacterized protein LOC117315839 [Pecten maximus]|uniref:uncharacterized protein LOC117315839 n=1 Tax=Pecten maximus TaxID=6579 RepID=UPI001458F96F|nr:uncharacterized protein LOC117315839 [Pecten maximus]
MIKTAVEIHDSTGDIDGGTQSPSNHGHRDDDDTIKDRRLCSARQKDDKDVTQTKDVQTKDVTQRNSLKDGLSNIPQQQCEEQNKPSDAVSITVTQDSQGISEILGMIASSQNKRGSTIVYPEESPSFEQPGEFEQTELTDIADIQHNPEHLQKQMKQIGKDRPLEEDMSKLPSPPDDLQNFQPVHDSAQIYLGSSEMVTSIDSTADTQSNQEIPPALPLQFELSKSLKIEEK